MSEIIGIHQSDIIIRSAIMAGIAELRASPYLLDYAFASLRYDNLTKSEYAGQVEIAKEWFKKTNIWVYMAQNTNEVKFPCVTISLASSNEDETTLADVHYEPTEDVDLGPEVLAGPMVAESYDPDTGYVVFSVESLNNLILAPGMVLITKSGAQYPVLDCPDITTTIKIETGLQLDLEDCRIFSPRPGHVADVGSVAFKETYAIGCHVDSEPSHLIYLHSIICFILLRNREDLLEARGFERSAVSSTDFRRSETELPEFFYNRYIQLTGSVRQVWPKVIREKVLSIFPQILPDAVAEVVDEETLLVALEMDSLGVKIA